MWNIQKPDEYEKGNKWKYMEVYHKYQGEGGKGRGNPFDSLLGTTLSNIRE